MPPNINMGRSTLPRYQPVAHDDDDSSNDQQQPSDRPLRPAARPGLSEPLVSRIFTALMTLAVVIILVMASSGQPSGAAPPAGPGVLAPGQDGANKDPHHAPTVPAWLTSAAPLEPEWEWARNATILYTWVNGSDPQYRELRRQYGGQGSVGGDRDRDNDDLKFSLRTVAQHLPWHTGRIVVVSPSPPSFVRLAHAPVDAKGNARPHASPAAQTGHPDIMGRVEWIDQDRLIPPHAQPTFSSNVVEAFLHRLPPPPPGSHLPDSEWIIHFNDDYTFPSMLHPRDFFTLGVPRTRIAPPGSVWTKNGYRGRGSGHGVLQYLENSAITKPDDYDELVPAQNVWRFSTFNTLDAIERAYGPADQLEFPPYYVKHAPFVYSRTALRGAAQKFETEVDITTTHRFRHYDDVITPLLVHAYTALEGSIPRLQSSSQNNRLDPSGTGGNNEQSVLTFAIVPSKELTPATLLEKWTNKPATNAKIMRNVRNRISHGLKFLAMNDEMGNGHEAREASAALQQFYQDLYGDKKSPFEV